MSFGGYSNQYSKAYVPIAFLDATAPASIDGASSSSMQCNRESKSKASIPSSTTTVNAVTAKNNKLQTSAVGTSLSGKRGRPRKDSMSSNLSVNSVDSSSKVASTVDTSPQDKLRKKKKLVKKTKRKGGTDSDTNSDSERTKSAKVSLVNKKTPNKSDVKRRTNKKSCISDDVHNDDMLVDNLILSPLGDVSGFFDVFDPEHSNNMNLIFDDSMSASIMSIKHSNHRSTTGELSINLADAYTIDSSINRHCIDDNQNHHRNEDMAIANNCVSSPGLTNVFEDFNFPMDFMDVPVVDTISTIGNSDSIMTSTSAATTALNTGSKHSKEASTAAGSGHTNLAMELWQQLETYKVMDPFSYKTHPCDLLALCGDDYDDLCYFCASNTATASDPTSIPSVGNDNNSAINSTTSNTEAVAVHESEQPLGSSNFFYNRLLSCIVTTKGKKTKSVKSSNTAKSNSCNDSSSGVQYDSAYGIAGGVNTSVGITQPHNGIYKELMAAGILRSTDKYSIASSGGNWIKFEADAEEARCDDEILAYIRAQVETLKRVDGDVNVRLSKLHQCLASTDVQSEMHVYNQQKECDKTAVNKYYRLLKKKKKKA